MGQSTILDKPVWRRQWLGWLGNNGLGIPERFTMSWREGIDGGAS